MCLFYETGDVVQNTKPTIWVYGVSAVACKQVAIGRYYCGEELYGELTESLIYDGYEPTEETGMVEDNECHVITEK